MAQPTKYTRITDFQAWQALNAQDPLPGATLDQELNALRLTVNWLCDNLAAIQRDDTKLANGSVHKDAFDETALSLIIGGFTPRGPWQTATAYAVSDIVASSTSTYVCAEAHTSAADFATDFAADKWLLLGELSQTGASGVSFTPSGTLEAINVQDALEELDADLTAVVSQVSGLEDDYLASDADLQSQIDDHVNTVDTSFHGVTSAGREMIQAGTKADIRNYLGLLSGATTDVGDAATRDVGVSDGNLVEVEAGGKLPALDGSQLTGINTDSTGLPAATIAQHEAESTDERAVTPGRAKRLQCAAKAWAIFNGTSSISSITSYGVTSINRNTFGTYTVTLSVPFSSTRFAVFATSKTCFMLAYPLSTTTIRVLAYNAAGALTDSDDISVICYGDQ